jgi:DNA-binding transcriptional ArsR family regulator
VTDSRPHRVLDTSSLQGLAHPLRVRLLDELSLHGSATATGLAARLGESSGATSYHLRQLEKFGFVEEDSERGSGRERWWRRVPGSVTLETEVLGASPAARDAALLVANELGRAKQGRIQLWRQTWDRWPREWANAGAESSGHVRVTAVELGELVADLDRVVTSWVTRTRDREGEGIVDVEVQWYAFPVGDPPEAD